MNKTLLISAGILRGIFIRFRGGLMRDLQAQGYRIVAAAPGDYNERLAGIVAEYHMLPMAAAGTSLWGDCVWWRYLSLLRVVKPTAMLTFTSKPGIYGALAARLAECQ